jgi:hypothetical protein
MSSAIEIDGKKLLPIKEAVSNVSYSRDYVTRLAREGKIIASNIGRHWFVDLDSLVNYKEAVSVEQEIRNKQLREERKKEQVSHLALVSRKEKIQTQEKYLSMKAAIASMLVGTFGLIGGWSAYSLINGEMDPNLFSNNNTSGIHANSNLASVSKGVDKVPATLVASSTFSVNKISDDVSEGVLLLPERSLNATVTDMFSDEVQILTNNEGVQVVVRVDKDGMPVGNVIPFVKVPVNYSDR